MVRLKLMPPLTRLVGAKEIAVDVPRASLRDVLDQAAARNGKLRRALLDGEGKLSAEYSCLVNGRRCNASDLDGIEVEEADEIVILMPIAGGASPLPAGEQGGRGAGERWRGDTVAGRRGDALTRPRGDARFTPDNP